MGETALDDLFGGFAYRAILAKFAIVRWTDTSTGPENMDYVIRRQKTLSDGRVETFTPMTNADGYFILADRVVDKQHNKATNQFFVKDPVALIARLRKGGVSIRMRGDITGQPNLIRASEVEVIAKGEDDPFASFTEWAGADDDEAYGDL